MIRDRDTLNALLDSVERFVRERLVPAEHVVAETDEIPEDIVAGMKELGLFGLTIPEEYGGLGLTMEEEALVIMAMGQTSPAFRSLFGTTVGIGSQGILLDGLDEQKRKYLPKLATGEIIASFALTEPEAGSDAASLRTTRRVARRRSLRRQRHKALHHQRAAGGHLHADGAHESRATRAPAASRVHRRARHAWHQYRQAATRRWASRARTPAT